MDEDRRGTASERAAFARRLGTLKREGSNVLLVGAERAGAHGRLCRKLLGGPHRDARYRLRVTAGDGRVACGGPDAETERVRTVDVSRSALRSDGRSSESQSPRSVGVDIVGEIDGIADDADGLAPSELRVCVDSLVPLVREYDPEAVFRLLHVTTARVDDARAMGHYHLPLAPDHDAVNLFEPLFDAVVTVRTRGGTVQQRWDLRETETTTGWHEVRRNE